MSLTRQDIDAVLDQWDVTWFNHSDKQVTFPKFRQVPRYVSIHMSAMQDQLDRIEAQNVEILKRMGVE